MQHFNTMVFEPVETDPRCVVMYYCAFSQGTACYSSESYWIVPGTLED